MVTYIAQSTFCKLLCGVLFVAISVVPSKAQDYPWIKKTEYDFRASNEAVLFDPKKVVICSVDADSAYLKDDGKYILENSFDGTPCSHLVYSRYYVDDMFNIILDNKNEDILRRTRNLTSKYPHLKIILEISLKDLKRDQQGIVEFLKQLMSSGQKRYKFTSNIKELQKRYGINGIYLDLTFFYYTSTIAEFKLLANEFRDAFSGNEKFILAIQVPISVKNNILNYYTALSDVSKIFDFVFVRAYDFYWHSGEGFLAVNAAPLYSSTPNDNNIYDNLQYLITTMRIDPEKVILQMSFVGRTYTLISAVNTSGLFDDTSGIHFKGPFHNENRLGYWGYNEVCSDALYNENSQWNMYWDEKAMSPFAKSGTRWITFENPRSVILKTKLAQQLGLGGTFSTFIDADDFEGRCTNVTYPLLRSINLVDETLNDSLVCSMYEKENTTDPRTIISCNFYVKHVRINDTVEVQCTVEGYNEVTINWMKVAQANNEEIKTINSSELSYTRNHCSSNRYTVSKLQLFINSEKDIGKYVILASNVKSMANSSIFIALQDHPYVVSDDNIWIEETKMEFPLINKNDISAYKLYEVDPVVFCTMDWRNQKRNVTETSGDNFVPFLNTFDGNLCTHIVFSEALIDSQLGITKNSLFEFQIANAVANLKKRYPHLKFMVELSSIYKSKPRQMKSLFFSTEEDRSVLYTAIRAYLKKFQLNGAVLQQFYYYHNGASTFQLFTNELSGSFHKDGFLIGMEAEISGRIECANRLLRSKDDTCNNFDFISLKAHRLTQSESKTTKYNFPLSSELNKNTIEGDLKRIIDVLGVNSSKLVLQIPFFGVGYTLENPSAYPFGFNSLTNSSHQTEMPYNQICSSILSEYKKYNETWKMYWDHKAKVPFLKNGKEWISFDNSRSIYEKMIIVAKNRLKGVMIRSVNQDDIFGNCSTISFSLLRTVDSAIKQTMVPKSSTLANLTLWYIIGSTLIILFVTLTAAAMIYRKRNRNDNVLSHLEIRHFRQGYADASTQYEDISHVQSQPYDITYEILSNRYEIDHSRILGSGQFGIVLLGSIKNSFDKVAVKSVKPGSNKEYINSLLTELKIMIYLNKHPNIIGLVGASTTKLHRGIVYIFVEYSPIGSLYDYLRKSRDSFFSLINDDVIYNNVEPTKRKSRMLTTGDLLIWSYQIASGLHHLSTKKIIHGDLATRNVLMFENNVVKISDFGLSRKLYDYNYVKKNSEPLPWRWMAIESLRDMTFSVQSDIWSYGVTLWEMFSLAEVPYPGLKWTIDFTDMLQEKLRLPKPKHANSDLYEFMLECWRENPKERPTAETARNFFYKFAQEEKTSDQDAYTVIQDGNNYV